MIDFKRLNRWVAAGVTLVSLFVYLKTVAPTVTFWDTGEFIAASHILGVPHPPGAPFHTLLGRFFAMLPIPGEVAFRVNLISVFAAAATALFIYLCVVRLLRVWLDTRQPGHAIAVCTGGAVAALSVAFSTSFWSNATEAEVYALSMGLTLAAFWLALRWDDAHREVQSDRQLLVIAYLFGLGAGVHLQALLTVPGILILVYTDLMEDRRAGRQVLMVAALTLYPFLSILAPMELTTVMTLAILIGLIVLRPEWRNPWFWIAAVLVAGLGYSTYLALIIRSGLNPLIDMNNPESWDNFKAFLARQQYGTHSIFPRRADFWAYQINIHIKYFLQQFPNVFDVSATFRRAVDSFSDKTETVAFSLVPILLGTWGAVYHLAKDWKRFAAVFSMFAIMGLGLVIYLNMPDPEPREREYIFVGAYAFFGLWMGMGAAGIIVWVQDRFGSFALACTTAAILMLIPTGILARNYFSHDRSSDYIAHDYAYNILSSCEPNALLFTNGDNDTYPLWFLQTVKGVRRDVRIANLSLLKTSWYVKQLRDLEPKLPVAMTDEQVDQEVLARPWRKPMDVTIAGITIKADEIPTMEYRSGDGGRIPVVEPHTWMVWYLVSRLDWSRPIAFAVTVPTSNMAGLKPYLTMEGMVYTLGKVYAAGQFDLEKTARNLLEVYRYTAVADSTVYRDPVARRLLGNYLVVFDALVRGYLQQGMITPALQTLLVAEKLLPQHAFGNDESWAFLTEHYWRMALRYAEAGRIDSAQIASDEFLRTNPDIAGSPQFQEVIAGWQATVDSAE